MPPSLSNTPSGNQNAFYGQKVSIPGINVNNAGDNQLIYKTDYSTELFYSTSGIPTVLSGLRSKNANNGLASDEQGFFVSQSGVDVTQATDTQLVFNSGQNIFKIAFHDTGIIPGFTVVNGQTGNSILIIAHGLSITPIINAFCQAYLFNTASSLFASAYIPLPISGSSESIAWYYFPNNVGGYNSVDVSYAVDSTNIYIQAAFRNASGSSVTINAIPVSYFALQQTAN